MTTPDARRMWPVCAARRTAAAILLLAVSRHQHADAQQISAAGRLHDEARVVPHQGRWLLQEEVVCPPGCTRFTPVNGDGEVGEIQCVDCPAPGPPPPFPPPSPPPRPPSPPNPPPPSPPPSPPPPTSNQVNFNGTLTTYDTSKRSQQEIKAVLNEVQRAVVTFLLNLLAPPNNVDVLQVTKKGAMYLSFNVQVTFYATQSVGTPPAPTGSPPAPAVQLLDPDEAAQTLATQAATNNTALFVTSPELVTNGGLQLTGVTLDTTPVAGIYLAPPPPLLIVPNKPSTKLVWLYAIIGTIAALFSLSVCFCVAYVVVIRKREAAEDVAALAAAHAAGETMGRKGNMDLSFLRQVDFPVNDDPAGMLEDSNAGIPAGPHAAAGDAAEAAYASDGHYLSSDGGPTGAMRAGKPPLSAAPPGAWRWGYRLKRLSETIRSGSMARRPSALASHGQAPGLPPEMHDMNPLYAATKRHMSPQVSLGPRPPSSGWQEPADDDPAAGGADDPRAQAFSSNEPAEEGDAAGVGAAPADAYDDAAPGEIMPAPAPGFMRPTGNFKR